MGRDDENLPEDEATDASDGERAAVLRRRAVFVAQALGGLALPVLVQGCSDPQPCLNIAAPPGLVPTATAPTSSATAPSQPTTSPNAAGEFSISAVEAEKLGLPKLGFKATMRRGGWSTSPPSKDAYVSASGPPGGPLSFIAKPYRDEAVIDALFRKALSDWSGLDPIEAGPAESVMLGGKKLEAQAFRTGKGMTTTSWCVVKAPVAPAARAGVLFLFGAGTAEGTKPTCKATLEHPALAEIVASLVFEG